MSLAVLTFVALTPAAARAQQGRAGAVQATGVLGTLRPDGTVEPLAGAAIRNARVQFDGFHVEQVAGPTGDVVNRLLATGTISGVAALPDGRSVPFQQAFTDVPAALFASEAAGEITTQQVAACQILDLDLAPINLNLLGLVLDTSLIEIDLAAQPGPGNLLGNLLCAIVGLLDG